MRFLSWNSFCCMLQWSLVSLVLLSMKVEGGQLDGDAGKNVTLRVGMAGGPPMYFPAEDRGVVVDLLESLVELAAEDNVNLTFITEFSGHQYTPGTTFSLVAKNCLEDKRIQNKDDCHKYDMTASPLFASLDRFELADLTPSWMQSYISASRYDFGKNGVSSPYSTFAEVERHGGTICAVATALYTAAIMNRYPKANYNLCDNRQDCNTEIRNGNCSLLAGVSFVLDYDAVLDPSFIRTKEVINKRFFVLPMSYTLDLEVRNLIKRWMYMAIEARVVDQILKKYLDPKRCELGYAGDTCEEPCDPDHGSSDRQGKCICDSTKWSGEDCSIEVTEDKGLIALWQRRLGYTMFSMNTSIVLVCAVWIVLNRTKPQVIIAQPLFLGLILLGCLISSSTVLALMQETGHDDGTVVYCMLIPWLYSIGFSITFGTLFAKIVRVHMLVTAASRMRKVQITWRSAFKWIFVVLLVDLVLLILWQVTDPLKWERTVTMTDKFGNVLSSVGSCKSEHLEVFGSILLSFHFVLMSAGSYMCYATRAIPEQLSGARSTSLAMISNLQIILVALPIVLLVGSDPETSFLLRSTFLWMNDLIVVVVIFGNLLFFQKKSSHLTAGEIVMESVRAFNSSSQSMRMREQDFSGTNESRRWMQNFHNEEESTLDIIRGPFDEPDDRSRGHNIEVR